MERTADGWFDLGLEAKRAHDWPESRRCNQRAVDIDPSNEGAWWNLGIAATALHDWAEARRAWKRFGVEIPDGSEETGTLGMVACVRLNPGTSGEVVWGERIDPARMVLASIPLPESGRRFRDIILHDGAPNGTRDFHGERVPVFDELTVWRQSAYRTFRTVLDLPDAAAADQLTAICEERGLGLEDWSTIRWICGECSRGNPVAHDCSKDTALAGTFAIAARTVDEVRDTLTAWAAKVPGAAFSEPVDTVAE